VAHSIYTDLTLRHRVWLIVLLVIGAMVAFGAGYIWWSYYYDSIYSFYGDVVHSAMEHLDSLIAKDLELAAAGSSPVEYIAYSPERGIKSNIPDVSEYLNRFTYVMSSMMLEYPDNGIYVVPRVYMDGASIGILKIDRQAEYPAVLLLVSPHVLSSAIYPFVSYGDVAGITIKDRLTDMVLYTDDVESGRASTIEIMPDSLTVSTEGDWFILSVRFRGSFVTPGRLIFIVLFFYSIYSVFLYGIYRYMNQLFWTPISVLSGLSVGMKPEEFEYISRRIPRNSPIALVVPIIGAILRELEDVKRKSRDFEFAISEILGTLRAGEGDVAETLLDLACRLVGSDAAVILAKNIGSGSGYMKVLASRGIPRSSLERLKYNSVWLAKMQKLRFPSVESTKSLKGIRDIVAGLPVLASYDQVVLIPVIGSNGENKAVIGVFTRGAVRTNADALIGLGVVGGLLMEVEEREQEVNAVLVDAMLALIKALESRDPYTAGHSQRVALLSRALALSMGLDEDEAEKIYRAAVLHDIGKEGIPDRILLKPGRLTPEEWVYVESHPLISAAIIESVGRFSDLVPMVMYHHTWYNGRGYPGGVAGEDLPLGSRIIAVADAVDAMATDRPYRSRRTDAQIIAELKKGMGTQFDPNAVEEMIRLIESGIISDVMKRVPPSCTFTGGDVWLRAKQSDTVLLVDIYGMEYINRKFGRSVGNKIIELVESDLRSLLGNDDVYRIFGDSFVVLPRTSDAKEIEAVLSDIADKVASILGEDKRRIYGVLVSGVKSGDSVLHYGIVGLSLGVAFEEPFLDLRNLGGEV